MDGHKRLHHHAPTCCDANLWYLPIGRFKTGEIYIFIPVKIIPFRCWWRCWWSTEKTLCTKVCTETVWCILLYCTIYIGVRARYCSIFHSNSNLVPSRQGPPELLAHNLRIISYHILPVPRKAYEYMKSINGPQVRLQVPSFFFISLYCIYTVAFCLKGSYYYTFLQASTVGRYCLLCTRNLQCTETKLVILRILQYHVSWDFWHLAIDLITNVFKYNFHLSIFFINCYWRFVWHPISFW